MGGRDPEADRRAERERADRRRALGRERTRRYRERLRAAGRLPACSHRRPVPRCPVCGRFDFGRGFERAGQHRLEAATGGGRGKKVAVATPTPEMRKQIADATRKALAQIDGGEVAARQRIEVEIQRRVRDAVAVLRTELDVETERRVVNETAQAEAAVRDRLVADADQHIQVARIAGWREGWIAGHAAGLAEGAVRRRIRIPGVSERRPAARGLDVAPPQVAAVRQRRNDVVMTRRVRGEET